MSSKSYSIVSLIFYRKVKLNKDKSTIKMPGFLSDINLYKKAIDEIAKVNFIK